MPRVPSGSSPDLVTGQRGFGPSPLTQVDPSNLLMAAATMDQQGRFSQPSPKNKFPNPSPKRPVRKLKVIK